MQQAQPQVWKLALQTFELGAGGAGDDLLRFLDQRADHKCLPAQPDLLADKLVGPGAAERRDPLRHDGLAAGR